MVISDNEVQEIRVIRDLMIGYDDKRFGYQALNRDKRKRDAACMLAMPVSQDGGMQPENKGRYLDILRDEGGPGR